MIDSATTAASHPDAYGPFAPIEVLSGLIQTGALKPSTLVADCLKRIDALDRRVHAFVEVYADEAMAAAEAHDRLIAAGHRIGPLHGIPVALKDLVEMKGKHTTGGSAEWRGRISEETATLVRLLEAAGMIVIGKTHMVEFAYGAWGTNAHMGAPWNPWDMNTHRICGGSSSGSAAAVAAGMVPAAIGTDSGGSVRIPASLCGIVGLKTTVGRVSRAGTLYLSPTVDTIGPMVRSVADASFMLDALQGQDQGDRSTLGVAPCTPGASLNTGVEGLRLLAMEDSDRAKCSGPVNAAYDAALQTFRDLGARVDTVTPPASLIDVAAEGGRILSAESYAIHKAWIDDETKQFDPAVRRRILLGRDIDAAAYIDILERRRQNIAAFDAFMADFDAMITPTTISSAVPLDAVDETQSPMSLITRAGNYLEQCAIAVPAGIDDQAGAENGLPLSIQVVGRAFDETRILRIARAFEQATDWKDRHPVGL
ncbi:amidase [Fodinicurvata sp. EGI_FJ10296]|uniref:amidase n=1 Tax=Fodinicurvata sp. EGI_FJ10296 TaxID=3231908 RepID=UPI003451A020